MKIFISYGNQVLSQLNDLKIENHFAQDPNSLIKNGVALKDHLCEILQENYSCNVFDYLTSHDPDLGWFELFRNQIFHSDIIIFFMGKNAPIGQIAEKNMMQNKISRKEDIPKIFCILLDSSHPEDLDLLGIKELPGVEIIQPENLFRSDNALFSYISRKHDGLPSDNFLFSYEKEIIDKFYENPEYFKEVGLSGSWPNIQVNEKLRDHLINNLFREDEIGNYRDFERHRVLASALTHHHRLTGENPSRVPYNSHNYCPLEIGMTFPEAGPRAMVYSPINEKKDIFRVAVIVSGGTAPGINAVINGIVQRHFNYYDKELEYHNIHLYKVPPNNLPYRLEIWGFHKGFTALTNIIPPNQLVQFQLANICHLYDSEKRRQYYESDRRYVHSPKHEITPKEINRPGSILMTGRELSLIENNNRIALLTNIMNNLRSFGINMVYIIGGEGSMRAAHALDTISQNNKMDISICGIPKTMDNDILWVWKTFGFHSAVYKASEFINTITYELKSNPRIGILQLFGSFSGFVVSHAVLGSKSKICDCAIIPEISFSLDGLRRYLNGYVQEYKKSLIVIAETVFPHDLEEVMNNNIFNLSGEEQSAIYKAINAYNIGCSKAAIMEINNMDTIRESGRKMIQQEFSGKTYKLLSHAILKIIADYLENNLIIGRNNVEVITCEPKYLIRDIAPSPIDIIFGNRLAILAVDNMLAGYTDFMISQWLTEFCLIPLKLVVLGTKRIPIKGIFWKSVIAKTGQPDLI